MGEDNLTNGKKTTKSIRRTKKKGRGSVLVNLYWWEKKPLVVRSITPKMTQAVDGKGETKEVT